MNEPLLPRWEPSDNYMGPDYSDRYVLLSRHRDSDNLEVSNFETAQKILRDEECLFDVIRCGHWGFGWVEFILIPENESKSIAVAENISRSLLDYPVLDDIDHSEREWEDVVQCVQLETPFPLTDDEASEVASVILENGFVEDGWIYLNDRDLDLREQIAQTARDLGFVDDDDWADWDEG